MDKNYSMHLHGEYFGHAMQAFGSCNFGASGKATAWAVIACVIIKPYTLYSDEQNWVYSWVIFIWNPYH
jgi:hypothetical protein